jgi:hypothetical protein
MICFFHIALQKYMAYAPYELPSYRYWLLVVCLGKQYAFLITSFSQAKKLLVGLAALSTKDREHLPSMLTG